MNVFYCDLLKHSIVFFNKHAIVIGPTPPGTGVKAFDPYNKALAIDKKHLGANEYLGELYLKVDKPKKAKKY